MPYLNVPDARLYYEVRGQGPLLVLVGAPMDASSFEAAADLLATDHTVLTTDPRGINRSTVADRESESTPDQRADDLHRLLTHLDAGPSIVFGSSGGAVTALALTQDHPGQVHTVIAHEPPFYALLEDREERHAAVEDIIAAYAAGDVAGAWTKFLVNANITLPPDADVFPGEPDPQQVADASYSFLRMLRGTTGWEPDLDALRNAPTRIVVGIGEESAGQLCDRTSRGFAAALGIEPTMFPGGHIGFADDPKSFAPRLQEVIS
jgi:pimeloyl-ACP methyl ester carboxylesterase